MTVFGSLVFVIDGDTLLPVLAVTDLSVTVRDGVDVMLALVVTDSRVTVMVGVIVTTSASEQGVVEVLVEVVVIVEVVVTVVVNVWPSKSSPVTLP